MFRRDKNHTLSSFIERSHEDNIIEEDHGDYYDQDYGYTAADPSTQGNKKCDDFKSFFLAIAYFQILNS